MTATPIDRNTEWLETDGLGGFASGTTSGVRTRRYHALLLNAARPPADRFVLVNGFEAGVHTPEGSFALTTQHYAPDVLHPDGATRILNFSTSPWPTWTYAIGDLRLEHGIMARHGAPLMLCYWRLIEPADVKLWMRPLISCRDPHGLHHVNSDCNMEATREGRTIHWHPYSTLPSITVATDGDYRHSPDWYRDFQYEQEQARGLDFKEDLASPGELSWDLSKGEAHLLLTSDPQQLVAVGDATVASYAEALRGAERARRKQLGGRLERAADAYLVRRGGGQTIVAGYPWFGDWGRDAFIAIRGLCLATGRLADARRILVEWADTVSEGMVPNRFPDRGDSPEYNSVDASLWYVLSAAAYLDAAGAAGRLADTDARTLRGAIGAIVAGYAQGTRYGIAVDTDGLVRAGEPGVQLTWMDAKVGDWVVTPRIGKPVEIQALWLNALAIAARWTDRLDDPLAAAQAAFEDKFWNAEGGYLYDVVDVDHVPGKVDATFRPNQLFAAGGLPLTLVSPSRARQIVDAVEARLWTPIGPRSLCPEDPAYAGRYEGGVLERDGCYHQGTVWPWLSGAFVEAWVRARGDGDGARRTARNRFYEPLFAHLDGAGLGHVSEIADGDTPHAPRGCPFQAWSVAELLRLDRVVLRERG